MKSRFLWLAAAGLAAIVAGANLASGPLNRLFLAVPGIDKVAHVAFHCGLFACVGAIAATRGFSRQRQTQIALVIGLLVAVADESVQGLVSGRSVEVEDLVANVCGLALGWVLTAKPPRAQAAAVALVALLAAAYVTSHTYSRLADYSRALRYEQQQDFVTARTLFHRALDAGMHTPGLYNELGWVEIESGVGDPMKAVEYAKIALDMQPHNADILDTYGWALHHAGRSREALAPLLAAFEKNPRMFCIHYHLGEVYLALGRVAEAEAHFRNQLRLTGTREARFARQALDRMAVRQ